MKDAHLSAVTDVLETMRVDPKRGLTGHEARVRRSRHGPNRLQAARQRSPLRILVAQFESLVVYLLATAAGLSVLFAGLTEGIAIVVVLLINAAIGFTAEYRAMQSMESLRRLSHVHARVRREGSDLTLAAEEIVPGDIVILEAGMVVTADLRLIRSRDLQCDESALTGESLPVAKQVQAIATAVPLDERFNMAFKGTAVTRGTAVGVVVATGMATELGRIAALTEQADAEVSPLEKRLDRLGAQLVWATLIITAAIAVAGILAGQDLVDMVRTAVALAVAAVPEGLPIVATVALARGMWRMARRNALVKTLSAVETLGATTIILTDKTGTLTENRMAVTRLRLADADVDVSVQADAASDAFTVVDGKAWSDVGHVAMEMLRLAMLCNNAPLQPTEDGPSDESFRGDPMELALLDAGAAIGLSRTDLTASAPRVHEFPFSAAHRMMATVHGAKKVFEYAVKGAPEAVIAASTRVLTINGLRSLRNKDREVWKARNEEMAGLGLRVLAIALKQTKSAADEPYKKLVLLGLIGMRDPPRADVSGAIAACRLAGVRVVMVTGDHAGTANAIAADIGLDHGSAVTVDATGLADIRTMSNRMRRELTEAAIFARVNPETKLELVKLFQDAGHVVAMTGDGINDAPALRKADIGVAMGQRGTEVAREAADIVLRDDSFPSIVVAMRYGRIIFGNIRKFVIYLLSCNLSEILLIALAALGGLPLPLLPLQILYLNLVTDVFPAFALGIGEGQRSVMAHPPRDPAEPIIMRKHWLSVLLHALVIATSTLGAFLAALAVFDLGAEAALAVSFLTLALAQLWHVFNMRASDSGFLVNEVTRNRWIWVALALCVGLLAVAIYVPFLSHLLGMAPPDRVGWMLIAACSLVPVIAGPVVNGLARRFDGYWAARDPGF
ncbi:MAG: cation-transporting P-type ATPase [Alphaproteobacteria bacterium]|nr:cation-transporting P-type ATPase [Alphaproteobacteria bacterium]